MKKIFATFIIACILVCLGANIVEAKPKNKKILPQITEKVLEAQRGEKSRLI